ncbi:MAG: hypothetical protein CSB55_02735 [Candidatus Cloacimonadota bacterium]|nr:MAG: hypothetical protein CSB55_02735 [Candidatus Cloacimonadota bacterium]
MRKNILFILIVGIFCSAYADKYAGEIFRAGAGVRNLSLGRTGVTDTKSASLAYWNSALVAEAGEKQIEVMHSEEYDGLMSCDIISGVFPGKYNFSFTVARVALTGNSLTELTDPEDSLSTNNIPYEYKKVTNSDYIAYFGFTADIGGITLGISPKTVYRSLAENSGYGFGVDISSYKKWDDNLIVGIRFHDIITAQVFWENGTRETVNPGIDAEIGYSIEMPVIKRELRCFFGAETLFEGIEEGATLAFDPVSMDFHGGIDLAVHENVNFLAGYDINHFTAGLSMSYKRFKANYGFEYDNELENSHRISLGMVL